jgi:hypothetical protein
MTRADSATVVWDPQKKKWICRIQIGAEVIRRAADKVSRDAPEDDLRSVAVRTATDEGYELDPARVIVTR